MSSDILSLFGDKSLRQERYNEFQRRSHQFIQNPLSVLGLLMIGTVVLIAIFAPEIAPYPEDVSSTNFDRQSQPPSFSHPMGTDTLGRDIFSRVLFGARISLKMAAIVLSLSISVGTSAGLVAGYFGGWIKTTIMRTVDIFLSLPPILLAMAVTAALGPSLLNAMLAITFVWWAWYARLVQGEVLSVKEEEFVEASESLGAGWPRIIIREILPNIMAPVTVKATLDMGFVILVGAGLAFLGLGAEPPTPSWGIMISQGRANVTSLWWIATFPGIAISFTVLGFNLLGDGLRDMFDVEV